MTSAGWMEMSTMSAMSAVPTGHVSNVSNVSCAHWTCQHMSAQPHSTTQSDKRPPHPMCYYVTHCRVINCPNSFQLPGCPAGSICPWITPYIESSRGLYWWSPLARLKPYLKEKNLVHFKYSVLIAKIYCYTLFGLVGDQFNFQNTFTGCSCHK